MTARMGPVLRGGLPPYTPSGLSSYARTTVSYEAGATELDHLGHTGIILRWQAHPERVAELLPQPLRPAGEPGLVYLFLGQTQSYRGPEFARTAPPQLSNWHEARFMLPCTFDGLEAVFVWATYKNHDHDAGIELGLYQGLVTKGARFYKTFPFPGQPLNREMQVGSPAHVVVDRFDQRLITGTFMAERECTGDEIGMERLLNQIGIRYMPDWADNGPPLVHDLVLWNMRDRNLARSWAGDGNVVFGVSPDDEVSLLAPERMLESYFAHFDYRMGPGTCSVLHDYVER